MSTALPGVGKGTLKERRDDLYETPPEATLALLREEPLPHAIWEPCCGPGAIARVLRAHGHRVVATDLVDYASPDQDAARIDFLLERSAPPGVECILSNPPFKLAAEFVRHALRLCPRVVMFQSYEWYGSAGRSDILDGGQLTLILAFRDRLPMMHRAGWTGRKTSSFKYYAWYFWDRAHRGPTTIRRISRERAP